MPALETESHIRKKIAPRFVLNQGELGDCGLTMVTFLHSALQPKGPVTEFQPVSATAV